VTMGNRVGMVGVRRVHVFRWNDERERHPRRKCQRSDCPRSPTHETRRL
jgi:hypothetical protein